MSVLNKMLRDLEHRQQHLSTDNDRAVPGVAVDDGRPLWLNLLLVLSFILLCFAVYAILSRSVTASKQTAASVAQHAAVTAADSPVKPAADKADIAADNTAAQLPQRVADAPQPTAMAAMPADTALPDINEDRPSASAMLPGDRALAQSNRGDSHVAEESPLASSRSAEVPTQPAKPAARAVTIERAGLTVAQQAEVLMQQALAAEQSGELQQALQRWQQVQALTPTQSRPYLAQARIWQLLGQTAQSVQVLQQALAQRIVDADIQLLLAQQAAARQQWQQVTDLLPEQFELAQQVEYYGLKATALQQLGQPQAALNWFAQLVRLQPEQARWWLGAALAYDALQQRQQASLHFQQALQRGDSLSPASRHYIQQRLAATE